MTNRREFITAHGVTGAVLAGLVVLSAGAEYRPASFKEKPKRGSWDAWADQQMTVSTECPCIAWQAFNAVELSGCTFDYCLRAGKHDLTPEDWTKYLDFFDRH